MQMCGLDKYHCVTALFWVPDGKQKVGRSRITWHRTAEKGESRGRMGVLGPIESLCNGKGRLAEKCGGLMLNRVRRGEVR